MIFPKGKDTRVRTGAFFCAADGLTFAFDIFFLALHFIHVIYSSSDQPHSLSSCTPQFRHDRSSTPINSSAELWQQVQKIQSFMPKAGAQMQRRLAPTIILSNWFKATHQSTFLTHYWPLTHYCMLHNKETTCPPFYVCFPARMRRCDVLIMVCVSLKRDKWLLSVCIRAVLVFFITNL